MAFIYTTNTDNLGNFVSITTNGQLVSTVTTNVINFPGNFEHLSKPGRHFFIKYPLRGHTLFSHALTSYGPTGHLQMNVTNITNPLKFIIGYAPSMHGIHRARLTFQDVNTGETEVLNITGTWDSTGLRLDIIESKSIGTLSIIDGASMGDVEEVDGGTVILI